MSSVWQYTSKQSADGFNFRWIMPRDYIIFTNEFEAWVWFFFVKSDNELA